MDVPFSFVLTDDQLRWKSGCVVEPEVVHEPVVGMKQIPQAGVKPPSDGCFGYAVSALAYPVADTGVLWTAL
jgi:hypothetical protein